MIDYRRLLAFCICLFLVACTANPPATPGTPLPTRVRPTIVPSSAPQRPPPSVVPSSTPRATTPTVITVTERPTAEPVARTTPSDELLADELLVAINSFRTNDECPALTREPTVAAVAQQHAAELAATRRIDHRSADGATLDQRLARAGYQTEYAGENIAAGYRTASEVIAIWTEGDEYPNGDHRLNMLTCAYRYVGIGLARADDGYPYWVLNMTR